MFSRTTRMKRTLTLGALAASAALVLSACSGGLASGGETDSGGDFFGAFDDWWAPYLLGVGPAGDYVAGLDHHGVDALR